MMIDGAHERGMEVMAYRSIGASGFRRKIYHVNLDEAEPEPLITEFAERYHPRSWTRTREGKTWLDYGAGHMLGSVGYLNFHNRAARVYERRMALEFVEGFGADGFQLEWIASPRPSDDPDMERKHTIDQCLDEKGYWAYGYDEEAIEDFKEKYGEDPRLLPSDDERWVQFRCEGLNQFVRELKEDLSRVGRKLEISAQGVSGVFRSREAGRQVNFDWGTWLDEGLIDAVYPRFPAHYPKLKLAFDEDTNRVIHSQVAMLKEALGGKASLMAGLLLPTYSFLTKELTSPKEAAAALERAVDAAVTGGADWVGIYRADRLDALGLWPHLRNLTRLLS